MAKQLSNHRIRYVESPGTLTAIHEKRGFFGWKPTGIREHIDMARAEKAMRALAAKTGDTAGYGSRYGGYDDISGFGDKLKSFGKKLAKNKVSKVIIKAHVAPLKAVHKITHSKNSPLRKMEMKVQGAVTKALPFTKPFIDFHNKVGSTLTNKALSKVGIAPKEKSKLQAQIAEEKRKLTAKEIVKATKSLPPAKRKAAQKELVARAKQFVVQAPSGTTYRFNM